MRRIKVDIPVSIFDSMTAGTYWFDIQDNYTLVPVGIEEGKIQEVAIIKPDRRSALSLRFWDIRFNTKNDPVEYANYTFERIGITPTEYEKIFDKIMEFNSSKFNTNDTLPSLNITEFVHSVNPNLYIEINTQIS